MPYLFEYSNSTREQPFYCSVECNQCQHVYKDKNGNVRGQCEAKVCIGLPYCWRHLRRDMKLYVGVSNIPDAGKGVFAYPPVRRADDDDENIFGDESDESDSEAERVVIFPRGTLISLYDGELITKEEVDRRYSESEEAVAPYVYKIGKMYIDAACRRGIGGMLNFIPYKRGEANPNNVKARVINKNNKQTAGLYALRDIYNGEELYLDYGPDYSMKLNEQIKERHKTRKLSTARLIRRLNRNAESHGSSIDTDIFSPRASTQSSSRSSSGSGSTLPRAPTHSSSRSSSGSGSTQPRAPTQSSSSSSSGSGSRSTQPRVQKRRANPPPIRLSPRRTRSQVRMTRSQAQARRK